MSISHFKFTRLPTKGIFLSITTVLTSIQNLREYALGSNLLRQPKESWSTIRFFKRSLLNLDNSLRGIQNMTILVCGMLACRGKVVAI